MEKITQVGDGMNIITKKKLFLGFIGSHRIAAVLVCSGIASMYITTEFDLGGVAFYL